MKHTALVATVLLAALSGFAKTFDVDISTGRPAASNEAYYHGETIEFRAVRGRSVVTNIEYASIYYQTNGMGDVWWKTDGLTFHPTNDVGAASYRFFMEGRDDLGRDWHANGLLRLLPSPGFTPNEITMPVATLDFATVDVLNPPYYDKAETEAKIVELAPAPGNYAAVSNAAMNALSRAEAEAGFTEWVVIPSEYEGKSLHIEWVRYEFDGSIHQGWAIVDSDGEERAAIKDYPTATNLFWSADDTSIGAASATRTRLPTMADIPTAQINAATTTNALQDAELESLSDSISTLNDTKASTADATLTEKWTPIFSLTDAQKEVFSQTPGASDNNYALTIAPSPATGTYRLYVGSYNAAALIRYPSDSANLILMGGDARLGLQPNDLVATLSGYQLGSKADKPIASEAEAAANRSAISTLSDSISTLSNTTSTVFSGLAQLADEVAPAVNGYARLYSFVTGSTNANFVVTNYQLTAEAEAARTHFDPSDPDLDFSTVPPSLRLEDASSGTNRVVVDTRDWVVWYYAQKIGGAMAEAVSTAVDTCRAWCGFTATGLENPAPDTLVVDVPNIWLMAGKTFEKHIAGSNAVWIIRSSGVVMPISDNSQSAGGFLELTDAFGTPYIRFKKTESYFVDPAADGVEYDSATGAWLVTYTTTTCPKGGANAVLEGSTTYPGKAILKDEDDPDCPATITWTGSANSWVMHAVPKQIDGAVPPKMFFAAVVEVQGQDYIEYLRPMSVPSLMFNGTTYTSTVSGNELKFIAPQP